MATFFDESYYLKCKLAQLKSVNEKDADGNDYTLTTLQKAIADAGLTPETHYQLHGRTEKLNPNAYFNESEYLHAKLNQLKSVGEKDANGNDFTLETLTQAIEGLGLTVAEHYETFGSHETDAKGNLINPSNAFDANAYVVAKLAELVKTEPEKWAGKTASDVIAAIAENGMSPVTHYEMHGATEANAYGVPLVQTVPVTVRVENDPARAEVTGELVPSNYNAPTPPPAEVTADKAAPVTKPADVGGLTNATVSPTVTTPTEPVPVPGDADYVAPPANIVDTNDKPVVVVPPATEGGKPQFGVVGDNGTISGVDSTGKPTDTVIGKVDDAGTITPVDPTPPPADPTPTPTPDTTAPKLTGVSFTEGDNDTITLTFDEAVTGASAENFTVKTETTDITVSAATVSGKTVTLTVDDTAAVNTALVVTYNKVVNGGTALADSAKNKVADFTVGLVNEAASGKIEMGDVSNIYLDGVQGTLVPATIPVVTSETTGALTVHLKDVGSTLAGLPVAKGDAYTTTSFDYTDSPRAFLDQNLTANLAGHLYTNAKPIKIEATAAKNYNLVAEKGDYINMVDVGAGSVTKDAATALNISGAGKVLVNVDVETLTTIDASENRGGVYVNTKSMSPLAHAQTGELTSVKGGEGNDMFIMDMAQIGTVTTDTDTQAASARNFKLDAKLAGGTGDDLLALSVALDNGDHLVLNKDSFEGKLSGFEHIMLDKVGKSNSFEIDAKDFGTLGVQELILQSSANIKNVDGLDDNGTAPNISVLCPNPSATYGNTVNLDVSASKANQTLDLDVIMTNASTQMSGNPNGFLRLNTDANISTINLTGHDDNAIVNFSNDNNVAMTFDASKYSGKLEYKFGSAVDNIKLGTGSDTIVLGTVEKSGIDSITNLSKGDVLSFNASVSAAATKIEDSFEQATIEAALASLTDIAANTAQVFTYKDATYLVINDGTQGYQEANDAVVQLAGLTADKVVALGNIFA